MSDPVSSYRNTCQLAGLMPGGDPVRECSSAAISMVQGAVDGLRQGRMEEASARRVLAEGHAAYPRTPLDMQAALAAKLGELDSGIAALARARTGRTDHVAQTARPAARTASPAALLNAGIRPQLAQLGGSDMRRQIAQSLFADRAQTTQTLRALASMGHGALRDLVTARVGAFHADAVVEALGDKVQMEMRARVSDRAYTTLTRGAQRLEDRSTGDGLQAALNQLRGAHSAPVEATLVALGVDADELQSLLARQNQPAGGVAEARHELAVLVSDTMSGGATEMRELAQRYDAAHNMLDREGALFQLFPESLRQVSAQLGAPADASRSALGTFVQEDIADAASVAEVNKWIAVAAMTVSAIATGGLGIGFVGGLGSTVLRSGASVGIAYQHADEMATAAAAAETDAESADAARMHAHVNLGIAIAAAGRAGAAGYAAHGAMHGVANAAAVAGVTEAVIESATHVALHEASDLVLDH